MRCDVVRERIEESLELPARIKAHLQACSGCADYVRRWNLVQAGLVALAKEEPPQASLGFAERLVRRLESARGASQRRQQFIVEAGRRMVYATLLVALMLILGLVLPSSGPLRTPQAAESILAEPEVATMSPDQMIGIPDTAYAPEAAENPNGAEGAQIK
ncbi:MAG TPA: hypothetical protein VMW54_08760 [Terriglobia bacterium]|nr:hypothetical protein [Terriglobia bacterium]